MYTIQLDSRTLSNRVQFAINLPLFIAFARNLLFIAALLGFANKPTATDFVFLLLAIFFHLIVNPYVGFRCSYKALHESQQFRPLMRWMVPQNFQELTGHEYREIAHCFSGETARKLNEVQSLKQSLTVFDVANIFLYGQQFGRYEDWKKKDEKLKAEFKSGD